MSHFRQRSRNRFPFLIANISVTNSKVKMLQIKHSRCFFEDYYSIIYSNLRNLIIAQNLSSFLFESLILLLKFISITQKHSFFTEKDIFFEKIARFIYSIQIESYYTI